MEFGSEFRLGKKLHSVPEIVEDQNGAPRLDMSQDNPCVVQHPHYQMYSWRANEDVSLILSNSPQDNPSTEELPMCVDMHVRIVNPLVQLLISFRIW